MAQEYQIVRIIPDKKGKGGDKSGMTTHMGVVDIYLNINALLYAGRWRSMQGSAQYSFGYENNAAATQCKAIHVYYQYLSSPTSEPTIYIFGHQYEASGGNHDVIWEYTLGGYVQIFKNSTIYQGVFTFGSATVTGISPAVSAADIGRIVNVWALHGASYLLVTQYRILTVPTSSSITTELNFSGSGGTWGFVLGTRMANTLNQQTGIAKFVNVHNECFATWGNSYWGNFIIDTSLSGGIIARKMGCDAPINDITYTLSSAYSGVCAVSNDVNFNNAIGVISGYGTLPATIPPVVNVTINGNTYAGYSLTAQYGVIGTFTIGSPDNYSFSVPNPNPLRANGMSLTVGSGGAYFGTIQSLTKGATTTTGVLDILNTPGAHANIWFDGTNCNVVGISQSYKGTTMANVPYTMSSTALNWTTQGPSYGVARYNPTTGHVSNVGPVLRISELNQSVSSINLTIPVDGVASDYYQAGYTYMILFRTQFAAPGGNMYPIGDPTAGGAGLIPNYPSGAYTLGNGIHTFTDTHPDSDLLLNPTFQAPQATNNPPPTFTQMAYWDGCVWGVDVTDQSAIRRSGWGTTEIPFGVAEESFPSEDSIRIPAEDGRVLGMKVVGSSLIITTQRYSYNITGTQGNYGLVRFCTSMYGVAHERFCEWAGDAGESSDRLGFIGNDGKLYRFTPNYGTEVISAPIATSVDTSFPAGADLTTMRIHQLISKSYRMFIFKLGSALWALDYENGTWHQIASLYPSPEAFSQIYSGAAAPVQIYGSAGTLYYWFDDTISNPHYANLETTTIDLGSPETFKELCAVRIWVSDPTMLPIVGDAYSDEGVSIHGETRTIPLGFNTEPDPVRSPQNITNYSPGSGNKLDALNATAAIAWMGQPFVGHRFHVVLAWGYPVQGDIYAIDLFFKPAEGPSAG